ARHANDRLLDDVLGFVVAEACADGGAVDELPIGLEELAPARLIAQIAQTLDQRAPRGQQFIMLVDGLGMHSHRRTIARPGAFLQKSSHAACISSRWSADRPSWRQVHGTSKPP